jgi:hypothetical protein
MAISGRDGDTAPRSGSLLSLAPRPSPKARPAARRTERPAPSPILAALARSRDAAAEAPPAAAPEEALTAPAEAAVENAAAQETVAVEEPKSEAVPVEEVRAEDIPAESAPAAEPAPAEAPPAAEAPQTAKGLVARLRRQFTQGLPEGRAEARGEAAEPEGPKLAAPPQRSTLEELRFRLSEFRTEILVRAAGRGKPSR